MNIIWSAALRCANLTRLEDDLRDLEAAACDELHIDVMDGRFVSDFALGPEIVSAVRSCSTLPCEAHLMVQNPEAYIKRFVDAGCSIITFHAETCIHAHRTLSVIRDAGATPGIAINPGTPLTKLEYLLPLVDRVLILANDPQGGATAVENSVFERVKILRENLDYREHRIRIQVEGAFNAKGAAILASHGAEIFVLDHTNLFDGGGLVENLGAFKESVEAESHVV